MSYEISLNGTSDEIEILKRDGTKLDVKVGDRKYHLDIVEVENGVYSILLDGTSFNVELVNTQHKKYTVNTHYDSFEVAIIDAETRYMNNRRKDDEDEQNFISTPMPGKVVKILVEEGQEVKAGTTLVIVSAMKMESEYKASTDKVVTKILVKEGDNIDGHQPLIMLD
jgi:biotin carboxyl carrier protein